MDKEFYLLGYWSNPYARGITKEYFWCGPFDTRKEALDCGKRKQQHGQPKTFINWCKGNNRVFSSVDGFVAASKKVGMNPRIDC